MIYWKQLLLVGLASGTVLSMLRARTPRTQIVVLMYHELAEDDADIESWTVVRKSDFLRQMEYLARHYDIVTLDDAIARAQKPENVTRPMVVITFDDGDRGNASVLLPIVDELKIPVTVYIATRQVEESNSYWFDDIINALQIDRPVTVDLRAHGLRQYRINYIRGRKNWLHIHELLEDLKSLDPEIRGAAVHTALAGLRSVERRRNCRIEPMSVAEVKTLASCPYITIGAHSHCHNILTQLNPTETEQSVRLSKTLLEQWTRRPINHFAYPNGSYNDSIVEIVQRAGFQSAVTSEHSLWRRQDDLLKIPRIAVGRYDSLERFKLNLVGGIRRFIPWLRNAKKVSRSGPRAWTR